MYGVGATENDEDTNSVFINVFHGLFGIKTILALYGNGHETALDVEISRELF